MPARKGQLCPHISRLLRLALIVVTLAFAIEPSFAQKGPVEGGPNSPYKKMRSTTVAQRQAAAQLNEKRKVAAGRKNQVGRNAYRGVTK